MKTQTFFSIVIFAILCFAANTSVMAQTTCIPANTAFGSIDTCFGNGGMVTGSVNSGTGTNQAKSVAVQADGKIVVLAWATNYPSGTGSGFYVLRYNTDGSLDSTFDSDGIAKISFTSQYDAEIPRALVIQPDGKIVVVGSATIQQKRSSVISFAVARLNSDGTLDNTFNGNGKVVFGFSTTEGSAAKSVALQPDGSIIVGGNVGNHFAVARLLPSGVLDNSFNGSGKLIIQIATSKNNSVIGDAGARGTAVQSDGKIVLIGASQSAAGNDFAVFRLNSNGSFDSAFGGAGKVSTDFYTMGDYPTSVTLDANNRIVVAGFTNKPNVSGQQFAIARYNPNGSLDTNFNGNGKVSTGFAGYNNFWHSVAIDIYGNINVAGEKFSRTTAGAYDAAVARYLQDGSLDASFGNSGFADTSLINTERAYGIAIQPFDGKIVVAGEINSSKSIGVWRYMP